MAELSSSRPMIAIVGPTASGKTNLATLVAQKLGFVYSAISVDSVQVYRGLEVGSAKPTREEREILPHELIDVAEPGRRYTVADYREDVRTVLEELDLKNRHCLFVGGTGFYFQALETGLFELAPIDPQIRQRIEKELEVHGLEYLYEQLKARDPEACHKIKPQDSYRVVRALEVVESQGRTWSEIVRSHDPSTGAIVPSESLVKVGLYVDREDLRLRVRARCEYMLSQGWIDEVEGLRKQGLKEWPALSSVGYKQIQQMLDGEIELSALVQQIETATMQLAKRQMTWFRRDSTIRWFDALHELDHARDYIFKTLN